MQCCGKLALVEVFIAEAGFEAVDVGILIPLDWADQVQLYGLLLDPLHPTGGVGRVVALP